MMMQMSNNNKQNVYSPFGYLVRIGIDQMFYLSVQQRENYSMFFSPSLSLSLYIGYVISFVMAMLSSDDCMKE